MDSARARDRTPGFSIETQNHDDSPSQNGRVARAHCCAGTRETGLLLTSRAVPLTSSSLGFLHPVAWRLQVGRIRAPHTHTEPCEVTCGTNTKKIKKKRQVSLVRSSKAVFTTGAWTRDACGSCVPKRALSLSQKTAIRVVFSACDTFEY